MKTWLKVWDQSFLEYFLTTLEGASECHMLFLESKLLITSTFKLRTEFTEYKS